MLSTCPNCLTQTLHQDDLTEITCQCGHAFATVLEVAETALLSSNAESPAHPTEDNSLVQIEPVGTDFSESLSVFQEIRDFGEGTLSGAGAAPPPAANATPSSTPPQQLGSLGDAAGGTNSQTTASANSGVALPTTHGDTLPGLTIREWLAPVSVWVSLQPEEADPLAPGFSALAARAAAIGADGIVAVRWAFTADGNRIVLSGTPVRT